MSDRAIVWNYGGGTQSAAIAVLIAQGRLPKPDVAVIADTGREDPATWAYMRDHVQPMLDTVGVTIQVAPHSLAGMDLYAPNGRLLLPVFTATGKLDTFCSDKWKSRVVQRYLRSIGYSPKRPVVQWIGYSLDEVLRIKQSSTAGSTYHWPLILDVPMRRNQCKDMVIRAGLPEPPKSSCWMCPHRRNEQWRDLRDNRPEAWEQAVALDAEIRAADTKGGVYLHRSLVPLAEADLSEAPESEGVGAQTNLFADDCKSGYCFV